MPQIPTLAPADLNQLPFNLGKSTGCLRLGESETDRMQLPTGQFGGRGGGRHCDHHRRELTAACFLHVQDRCQNIDSTQWRE